MNILSKKKIILGISGGIAAYKSILLLRELQKRGADVTIVMTKHAKKFISPLTFETLSKNPVYTDLFITPGSREINHISLEKKGKLLIIAPATANIIGKIANGIADDLLSSLFLSFSSPVLIVPSMNSNMFNNIAVQENISLLKKRGGHVITPDIGKLACGDVGAGRMPETEKIIKKVELLFTKENNTLKHKKILITAGPTKEKIDPVRFISNVSSGKMGYALAESTVKNGGDVILISGPTALEAPNNVTLIKVETCNEMKNAVFNNLDHVDIVIMCAAVCDYAPETVSLKKIKKSKADYFEIKLKKNPDILSEICKRKKNQFIVGFAAETENLISNAKKKLLEKNLDLIVANHIGNNRTGFNSEKNKVFIIEKNLEIEDVPELSKIDIADIILNKVILRLNLSINPTK